MTLAENHHPGRFRAIARRLAGPFLLFLLTVGFFWKLTLTNQYTWLDSPDIAHQVLPWLQFQAGEWQAGRLPLWSPYEWGGQPLVGQTQPGAAYPPNWLLFLYPLKNGWIRQSVLHWYFVLIHWVAALNAYALCRGLGCRRGAAILGGCIFAFGGYVGNIDWPQMLNGAIWAPLVVLFVYRATHGEEPWWNAMRAGFFLGLSWLAGHHQVPIFLTLVVGLFWIGALFRGGRFERRLLVPLLVFGLMLALTSALQMLPALEYGRLAKRWVGAENPVGWKDIVPYPIHQQYSYRAISLLGLVIPGLHKHTPGFVGVTALALAILGLLAAWKERHTRWLALFGLVGLGLALGGESVLHGVLYAVAPLVEKARSPSMAIVLVNLAVAVLAALGAQAGAAEWARYRRGVQVGLCGLAAALFLFYAAWALWRGMDTLADDRPVVTALVACLAAALIGLFASGRLHGSRFRVLLTALVVTELGLVSGWYYSNRFDANRPKLVDKLAEHQDIADFLRRELQPVRITVDDKEIPYNFGDWHGIDVFGGYLASLTGNVLRHEFGGQRTQRLFGVTHHVGKAPLREGQVEVFTARSGLKVFKYPDPFPRAWAVHRWEGNVAPEAVADRVERGADDLRESAFFVEAAGPPAPNSNCTGSAVRWLGGSPSRVVLEAEMACPGVVVLAEVGFPGWKAFVDGHGKEVLDPYGVLRGVAVPAGRHRVEFRYSPTSVYVGGGLTAIALILHSLAVVYRRRRA
ncbi:MAG: hypothetical protein MUC42_02795 [Bryobacter sp.]|nr:hypothetical protein [Bryobacter sp.]